VRRGVGPAGVVRSSAIPKRITCRRGTAVRGTTSRLTAHVVRLALRQFTLRDVVAPAAPHTRTTHIASCQRVTLHCASHLASRMHCPHEPPLRLAGNAHTGPIATQEGK
jgi:hypothetical protein